MWVGSPGGGIWKTTDGGANWSSANDNLPSLWITSIAIGTVNPDIMYAATGGIDPIAGDMPGIGILKSTDGGATWSQLGATSPAVNEGWRFIAKLAVHPANDDIVIATAYRNIWRSTNGGGDLDRGLHRGYGHGVRPQ